MSLNFIPPTFHQLKHIHRGQNKNDLQTNDQQLSIVPLPSTTVNFFSAFFRHIEQSLSTSFFISFSSLPNKNENKK